MNATTKPYDATQTRVAEVPQLLEQHTVVLIDTLRGGKVDVDVVMRRVGQDGCEAVVLIDGAEMLVGETPVATPYTVYALTMSARALVEEVLEGTRVFDAREIS